MRSGTRLFLLLLLPFFIALTPATAEEHPSCHADREDDTLFNHQEARDFFATRAQSNCFAGFEQTRKAYSSARAELQRLVQSQADPEDIDSQTNQLASLKDAYLTSLTECGPCLAEPIQPPTTVETGGSTQVWYLSDASCQLPLTDKTELAQAFQRATSLLTNPEAYPHTQDGGGLDQIMALSVVDNTTGRILPHVTKIGPEPNYILISLFGPDWGLATAFSYYFQNTYRLAENQGRQEFLLDFHTVRTPRKLRIPATLQFTTASGKTRTAINNRLYNVEGQWYVNSDGYLRYCTTADFSTLAGGPESPVTKFIETLGRDILLNTISQVEEKSIGPESLK